MDDKNVILKLKELTNEIAKRKVIIATNRDELRDIYDDLADLVNSLDDGVDGLERSVEASDTYQSGTCRVCQVFGSVRHKNLYVSGSEGLWICLDCEKEVLDFVRSMMLSESIKKKRAYKRKRSIDRLCKEASRLRW